MGAAGRAGPGACGPDRVRPGAGPPPRPPSRSGRTPRALRPLRHEGASMADTSEPPAGVEADASPSPGRRPPRPPSLLDALLPVIVLIGLLALTIAFRDRRDQRGEVVCVVTVRTLAHPLHSGEFGGPAPDAMIALARLLATLHDEEGNVAVDGVSGFAWDGADLSAEEFRSIADLLAGVGLSGSGPVGERLWSGGLRQAARVRPAAAARSRCCRPCSRSPRTPSSSSGVRGPGGRADPRLGRECGPLRDRADDPRPSLPAATTRRGTIAARPDSGDSQPKHAEITRNG